MLLSVQRKRNNMKIIIQLQPTAVMSADIEGDLERVRADLSNNGILIRKPITEEDQRIIFSGYQEDFEESLDSFMYDERRKHLNLHNNGKSLYWFDIDPQHRVVLNYFKKTVHFVNR